MFQLFYQSHALEIFGSALETADALGDAFVDQSEGKGVKSLN